MEKNESLELLKKNFQKRHEKSQDKKTLLEREIEANELIFDEKKLPLSKDVISSSRPIKYLNTYTHQDIVLIREAYQKYIVNGADIDEAGEWFRVNKGEHAEDDSLIIDGKGRAFKKFPPDANQIHYFNEAKIRYSYLTYLRGEFSEVSKKYSDKYYAWYHKILIAIGKTEQFTPGAKQEIINYGIRKYNTKGGFYQAYMDFDLTKRQSFVSSLTPKERAKWKKTLIDISNNDNDVIKYLMDFPE